MSSKDSIYGFGYGPASSSFYPYIITGRGTNSQGNHWDTRIQPGGPAYHYSNFDGSYYYSNSNGSTYYNSGTGFSTYRSPNGTVTIKYES